MLELAIGFMLGAVLGALICWLYLRPQLQHNQQLPATLRETFTALASQTLQATGQQLGQQFLQLAQEKLTQQTQAQTAELEGKKALIDTNLTTLKAEITGKLEHVTTLVATLEKDRENKFSALTTQLSHAAEQVGKLQSTTQSLTQALTNSRTRGQWGERMAEDVLQLAGFQPNIQYRKQSTLIGAEGTKSRPDFTFLLPSHRVLHMDVKFPLDRYLQWLNAEDTPTKTMAAQKFIQATRSHIKSTADRNYRTAASQAGETALDYILIFIPNEQVYSFLLEHAPETTTEALQHKVILCSPTTLLAVLAVIHQALQNFSLEQRASDIYTLLTGIRNQWEKFSETMAKMGKKIAETQSAYDELTTTRTNMLDRQFNKLDTLSVPETSTESPTTLLTTTTPSSTLN